MNLRCDTRRKNSNPWRYKPKTEPLKTEILHLRENRESQNFAKVAFGS